MDTHRNAPLTPKGREAMETWNTALFMALNAPASANLVTIVLAKIAAEYLVYVAGVWRYAYGSRDHAMNAMR